MADRIAKNFILVSRGGGAPKAQMLWICLAIEANVPRLQAHAEPESACAKSVVYRVRERVLSEGGKAEGG